MKRNRSSKVLVFVIFQWKIDMNKLLFRLYFSLVYATLFSSDASIFESLSHKYSHSLSLFFFSLSSTLLIFHTGLFVFTKKSRILFIFQTNQAAKKKKWMNMKNVCHISLDQFQFHLKFYFDITFQLISFAFDFWPTQLRKNCFNTSAMQCTLMYWIIWNRHLNKLLK